MELTKFAANAGRAVLAITATVKVVAYGAIFALRTLLCAAETPLGGGAS